MERTLISWNVPNLITVALMALIGWLVFGVVMQTGKKFVGKSGGGSSDDTSPEEF